MESLNIISTSQSTSNQSFQHLLTSLIGGSLGGIGSVFAGHPLDTLKVRMQVLNLRLFECCRVMFRKEGLTSFFKGMTSPLIAAPLAASFFMGMYETCRLIQGIDFHQQLTIFQASVAGAIAGGTYCMLGAPMELVKCRLQMEIVPKNGQATKVSHMLVKIVKEEGIRGLYRGNLAFMLREAPGSALYFGVYEGAKIKLNRWFGESSLNPMVAGGIAGVSYTCLTYPFDIIKTRLQCEDKAKYPEHRWVKDGGIVSCAKLMWRTEGMRGFWRGLSPSALRSVLTESVHFFIYEKTKKYYAERME